MITDLLGGKILKTMIIIFIIIFIHFFNKHFSCAYYVPTTVLDFVCIMMTSADLVYNHGGY